MRHNIRKVPNWKSIKQNFSNDRFSRLNGVSYETSKSFPWKMNYWKYKTSLMGSMTRRMSSLMLVMLAFMLCLLRTVSFTLGLSIKRKQWNDLSDGGKIVLVQFSIRRSFRCITIEVWRKLILKRETENFSHYIERIAAGTKFSHYCVSWNLQARKFLKSNELRSRSSCFYIFRRVNTKWTWKYADNIC